MRVGKCSAPKFIVWEARGRKLSSSTRKIELLHDAHSTDRKVFLHLVTLVQHDVHQPDCGTVQDTCVKT